MDITFKCDKCGQSLEVEETGAGMTVDCPKCGNPVYVPSSSPKNESNKEARSKAPSTYAQRVQELQDEAREKYKLTEYLTEEGVNEWKALKLASQVLKVLAVVSVPGWLAYPFLVWRHAQQTMSDASQMMGGLPVPMPSLASLGLPQNYYAKLFALCFLTGILHFAVLWVVSEILLLLISLEQNSGRTVRLLQSHRD